MFAGLVFLACGRIANWPKCLHVCSLIKGLVVVVAVVVIVLISFCFVRLILVVVVF